jgi:hypothetical protein
LSNSEKSIKKSTDVPLRRLLNVKSLLSVNGKRGQMGRDLVVRRHLVREIARRRLLVRRRRLLVRRRRERPLLSVRGLARRRRLLARRRRLLARRRRRLLARRRRRLLVRRRERPLSSVRELARRREFKFSTMEVYNYVSI